MWQVPGPSEHLAITGGSKALIWPTQKCVSFDISPVDYTFEVQAMSAEQVPFILEAVFTIGPCVTDDESLLLYAKLIFTSHDNLSSHIKALVQDIIESESRVIAASMTMEKIFNCTEEFKSVFLEKLQLELNQFGLVIYKASVKQLICKANMKQLVGREHFSNLVYKANVKQLIGVAGHGFFSNLAPQIKATNQVKVDVAKVKGKVGAALCAGQKAKIDAETKIMATRWQGEGQKEEIMVRTAVKILENQKEAELAKANAELATKKVAWSQSTDLAKVEAAKQVALREAELQLQVEKKKTLIQTEKLRAQLLSKAIVQYEVKVQEANGELYNKQKAADAVLYENLKKADAQKATADATSYTRQQVGKALAQSEGEYLAMLVKQFRGDYGAMKDYLMLRPGGLQELPKFSPGAEKGPVPKSASGPGAEKGPVPKGPVPKSASGPGAEKGPVPKSASGPGAEKGPVPKGPVPKSASGPGAEKGPVPKSASGQAGKPLRKGGGVGGGKKDVAGVNGMLPPTFKALHEEMGLLSRAVLDTLTDAYCQW